MEVRLDRLLGRRVVGANGRRVGRLEEFRVREDGGAWTVTEYVIGAAGLWERLGLGTRLLLGLRPHGYIARWDQIKIDGGERAIRLTCSVAELRRV